MILSLVVLRRERGINEFMARVLYSFLSKQSEEIMGK